MKVLAVAAWEPELTHLRERFQAAPVEGVDLAVEPIGVGVVEAAVGMTRRIAAHAPDVAVLVGTCGAFGAFAPGAVVVARRVRLVDASILAGDADLPPPMPAETTLDAPLHELFTRRGATSAAVANSVGITVSDALAERLARGGGAGAGAANDVEHLEAFAFARACACAAAPVRAAVVLGVANAVGARGREQWRSGHVAASARAADLVYASLAAIAEEIRTSTTAPSPARG